MSKLIYSRSNVQIQTPYDAGFVDDIKTIPPSFRSWDAYTKTWTVFTPYVSQARDITRRYFLNPEEINKELFDAAEQESRERRDAQQHAREQREQARQQTRQQAERDRAQDDPAYRRQRQYEGDFSRQHNPFEDSEYTATWVDDEGFTCRFDPVSGVLHRTKQKTETTWERLQREADERRKTQEKEREEQTDSAWARAEQARRAHEERTRERANQWRREQAGYGQQRPGSERTRVGYQVYGHRRRAQYSDGTFGPWEDTGGHQSGPSFEDIFENLFGNRRQRASASTSGPTFAQACLTLLVPETAAQDAVKRAYRALARQHHPDTGRTEQEKTDKTRKMQEINAAYDKIKSSKGWT